MRRLFFLLVLVAAVATLSAGPASADVRDDQKKAQEHFQKARDLYSQGSYRDALGELEVARGLDPKAKDLVMNLGIVNEKLGNYDDAIKWFHTFLDMTDVTAAEKSRAEGFIKRIEGAKKEAAAKPPPPPPPATTTAPAPPPPPPSRDDENAPKGRMDGATIGVGAIAAVGLAAGTTFGVLALTKRPTGFTTGQDGSYADLQSKTDSAHTMAIIADVSLGVGVVASIVTLYLYFGRTQDPAKAAALSRVLTGRFTF